MRPPRRARNGRAGVTARRLAVRELDGDDGGVSDDAPAPAYPPAPWLLHGRALCSVFRVPQHAVPGLESLPPGHTPVRVGSDVVAGLALVHYAPGGTLSYDELVTAVLTRPTRRLGLRLTVPQIWVTSDASVAGGRALWGIPKERCTVTRRDGPGLLGAEVAAEDRPVAGLAAVVGREVLPRFPVTVVTAQRKEGSAVVARHRVQARVHTLRARWQIPADGPLGHLAGRRPLLSVALTGMTAVFGRETSIASTDE